MKEKRPLKKVAIVQSNYIPWKGYFDLISNVDEFIIYDCVQYTRRDWRNRNKIKTPQGLKWLTVPVRSKGKYNQLINETEIEGTEWAENHWDLIYKNYHQTAFFYKYAPIFEEIYKSPPTILSQLNFTLIKTVCDILQIDTEITQSTIYNPIGSKSERLVSICKNCNADIYLSGPLAAKYLDQKLFTEIDIKVEWFNYDGYKQYEQLWGNFEHGVTILDLLFNCGEDSINFFKR